MQDLFKAIADPVRRDILFVLVRKDLTVTEINNHINVPPSTLSHHLNILYQSGLVTKRKFKTFIIYSATLSVIEELTMYIAKMFNSNNPRRREEHE